jgi:predicted transcriptional regulator
MAFEDDYMDVLQNIEFGIVTVYRKNNALSDYNVLDALEALISHYYSEKRGHPKRDFRLDERAQNVYDAVRAMCDLRIGTSTLETKEGEEITVGDKTVEEILECLKRIQTSVKKWNKRYGRQGYLEFIKDYVQ